MRMSDWSSDVCSSDLDAAEIGGLLDLVQTVPAPVVVEHVTRNGEQQPTQRGRLLDVAVADQPAPGFLCQISGILRTGPTSAEAAQQFGLVFEHDSIDVVIRSDERRGGKGGVGMCSYRR